MTDILHLFAGHALGTLAVERAIAECRSGRPVVIVGATSIIAAPVETLDAPLLAALGTFAAGKARLVLAGPRLERLGHTERRSAAVALPALDASRIERLAISREGRLDAPAIPLTPIDATGFEMMRLASLLPAFVAIPLADETKADAALARVRDADVRAYRSEAAADIHIVSRAPVPLEGALETEMVVFRGGEGLRDHAAVIVGRPDFSKTVTVRMHSACLTGDVFGSLKCDCGDQLRMTTKYMVEHGGGVILYLDQEGRGNGLSNKIKAYRLQADGFDTYDADEMLGFDHDQRRFDFAAAMLKELGVSHVRLMTNNPLKVASLGAAGLDVVSTDRIQGRPTQENIGYLAAKRDRAGHKIDTVLAVPPAAGSE